MKSTPRTKILFSAALRLGGSGVFVGSNHFEAFELARETGVEIADMEDILLDAFGFVDNAGKFYSRKEASDALGFPEPLSSEDSSDRAGV